MKIEVNAKMNGSEFMAIDSICAVACSYLLKKSINRNVDHDRYHAMFNIKNDLTGHLIRVTTTRFHSQQPVFIRTLVY